jgi:predicted MFS family arabinose efflux permease
VGRGAALGVMNVGWGAATLVGPLAAGAIAETIGPRVAYAGVVALALATAGWLALTARTRVGGEARALDAMSPAQRP